MTIITDCVQAHNFLIINDMHYSTNYTDTCELFYCADKGVYGNDSSLGLIKTVLDKAQEETEKFDAVIIQGDFIRHGFNIGVDGLELNQKVDTIMEMFKNLTSMVESRFPNTPILPVFGNNDFSENY